MSSGLFTLIAFFSFLCICVWAWSRHNRARFEEASRLPLDDEAMPACCRGKQAAQPGKKPS